MPIVTDSRLERLTIKQLKMLLQKIELAINDKGVAAQLVLKDELSARARQLGFSLDELFSNEIKRSKVKCVVPVKYRNPDNPEETWTGRGRMANWLKEKVKRGNKLKDYAV